MTEPDAFHRHEVLHTAYIMQSMWEDFVQSHVYTDSDPELQDAAAKISEQLASFYQLVGQKTDTP